MSNRRLLKLKLLQRVNVSRTDLQLPISFAYADGGTEDGESTTDKSLRIIINAEIDVISEHIKTIYKPLDLSETRDGEIEAIITNLKNKVDGEVSWRNAQVDGEQRTMEQWQGLLSEAFERKSKQQWEMDGYYGLGNLRLSSKMKELQRLQPKIKDFEGRVNIMSNVGPILEEAIKLGQRVVDVRGMG